MLTRTTPSARADGRMGRSLARLASALTAALLLGAGSVAFAAPAHAETVSDTIGGMTFEADGSDVAAGAIVTGYTPGPLSVTIPATVILGTTRYAVTAIGYSAFADTALTSVTIPDSVTRIGDFAFVGNALTSITLADSVTTIGEGAFSHNALTTLSLPDSVTTIGPTAFAANRLTSLTLPDSVTTIGEGAFVLNLLSSLRLGSSVASIGAGAFTGNYDYLTNGASESAFTAANATLKSVVFTGAPPATATAAGAGPTPQIGGSFGPEFGLVVSYPWAFDETQTAHGFTAPTWKGYASQAVVAVNFDLNGFGAAVAAQSVVVNSPTTEPSAPVSSTHTFTGWFTDAAATDAFSFATTLTGDTTLYAGWTQKTAVVPPTPGRPTSDYPTTALQPNVALAATGTANPGVLLSAAFAALLLGGLLIARRRIRAT